MSSQDASGNDSNGEECPECGGVFTETNLPQHIRLNHPDSDALNHECPNCDRSFSQRSGLGRHHAHAHGETINEYERRQQDYECPTCGVKCKTENGMRSHHKQAHGESIRGILVECDYCGEETRKSKSLVESTTRNFCSFECQGKWRRVSKEDLLAELRRLGEELGRRPKGEDMEAKGEYGCRVYFRHFDSWNGAVEEAGYEPYEVPRGKEHPSWNGGNQTHYGANWRTQRKRAIQRDNETCAIPGCSVTREDSYEMHGHDLDVHHITRKEAFRNEDATLDYEAANDLSNLITLCREHHNQYEGIPVDIRSQQEGKN